MSNKVIEVVCGVVFDRQQRLLAAQRPAGKALAGKWEFPGGKLEKGETAARALSRELDEELSLHVTVLDEMYRLTAGTPDNNILILYFLRAIVQDASQVIPQENQQFCWVEKKRLNSIDWLDTDKEFVEYLTGAYGKD